MRLCSTGAQGKSVVAALARHNARHSDKLFKIRGVVRNPESDVAKQLIAEYGAQIELVRADVTNAADLDHAFTGASHVFAVTAPWDQSALGKEVEIGGYIASAAKKAYALCLLQNNIPGTETNIFFSIQQWC
jgi:uncharacterized protein YbjT (DUF2867 family)